METVSLKPDFDKTKERFAAWWEGEIIDRPLVNVAVKSDVPHSMPVKEYASERERWLDIEFRVDSLIEHIVHSHYVGDSLPVFFPNIGPELTGTVYGCELQFSETTSWSIPPVRSIEEWRDILQLEPNFDNPYWRAIEDMTSLAIEKCDGRYLIGIPDLHGNYDILAALREPQELCMDIMDDPELIIQVGRHVARGFVECFQRCYRRLAQAGFGSTSWIPFYHPGPAYIPSSDFWCMLSAEFCRKAVLPDILTEMEPLERSIFHLDGPQALRHLNLLLDIPTLNAVQWVYGAGNGPAARWIDVYKRIQAAGKGFLVHADDANDALTVLEETGPRGAWLFVGRAFDSVEEAERFIREVEKLTRRSA